MTILEAKFEEVPEIGSVEKCQGYNFHFGRFQSLVLEFGEAEAPSLDFFIEQHLIQNIQLATVLLEFIPSSAPRG